MKTYKSKVLFAVMCFLSIGFLNVNLSASATPVVLTNMPAYYIGVNGCAPTAAGMILGYWSLRGYTNLFSAQGTDLYLTVNVKDQISSPAHNDKYLGQDKPEPPTIPYTSIADWLKTSVYPSRDGWTIASDIKPGIIGYAEYRGYTFQVTSDYFYLTNTWNTLVLEINNNRPMLFCVNSGIDGSPDPDHYVPVFGYDDRGVDGKWYACYDTWSENKIPRWERFQEWSQTNNIVFGISRPIIKITPPKIIIPAIISISPPSTNIGASAFTLTINGSNFVSTSIVSFNGLAKTTTVVNSTKLTIPITTNDLLTASVYNISVENPGLCGGTSNPQTFTVNNLTPIIVSILPKNKTINANSFDLIIIGTNFISTSTAKFNGLARNTTYLNRAQLKVSILKSDLSATGVYPITVSTPDPGGGISNSQNFTVIKGTLICIF